jgi:hypothetical protein
MDPLLLAVIADDLLLVDSLLTDDTDTDPTANDYEAVKKAVTLGYKECVARLLEDPRVNHLALLEWVVPIIIQTGLPNVVKLAESDNCPDFVTDPSTKEAVKCGMEQFTDFIGMLEIPNKQEIMGKMIMTKGFEWFKSSPGVLQGLLANTVEDGRMGAVTKNMQTAILNPEFNQLAKGLSEQLDEPSDRAMLTTAISRLELSARIAQIESPAQTNTPSN